MKLALPFFQATRDFHAGQISIEGLLAGRANGHALRWAEEFLKNHLDSTENCAQVLHELLREAQKLSQMKIATDLATPVDEICQRLNGYGSSFPTKMKFSILDRELIDYQTNHARDKFLEAVWPLCCHGADVHAAFKPVTLLLVSIEGSAGDRAATFRNKIFALFTGMVERGADEESQFLDCLDSVTSFADKHNTAPDCRDDSDAVEGPTEGGGDDPVDPAIDDAIDSIMEDVGALRLLLLVGTASLRPTHLHYSNGLREILDGRNFCGQSALASPCHALSIERGGCSAY